MLSALTPDAIRDTYAKVGPHLRVTPVIGLDGAAFGLPAFPLTLKLELLQKTGSFKARGAFASLLLQPVPAAGVVAASGGNHGAAVAFAAASLGHPAHVFVPAVAAPSKIEMIRAAGATLTIAGERYADALAASRDWAQATGAREVHAFNQCETILGQATLGLEFSGQAPGIDTVLVAIGGGGLISGVASWYQGRVRVVGVEPISAPTMTAALAAGRPVDAPAGGIAADSLAPRQVGETTLAVTRQFVNRVVLVDDDAIRMAQAMLWDRTRVLAEPGGAAALAALLCGAYRPEADERVGVIVCGGNVTTPPLPMSGPTLAQSSSSST
ncbi:MAG: threonine/serine dehydratase [Vicinamibacterales bacterium]